MINTVRTRRRLFNVSEQDNSRAIVSRIQHRRGLKQDLPQPLRPGELGFAVDSRQLYIGGDPDDPNAAQYYNLSYFENTANAREHTLSIGDNNIIAFTVPFIRYTRGEFNGISSVKQWFPTDARSIIDGSDNPECSHQAADKPVFSTIHTAPVNSTIGTDSAGLTTDTIYVTTLAGDDLTGNIRAGDYVTSPNFVTPGLQVLNVYPDPGTGEYTVVLNQTVITTSGSNISFIPNRIKNFTTNETFKNGEVFVYKNGLQLTGDPDSSQLTIPGSAYEYVLNASNSSVEANHTLNLRTRPLPADEVTLCYYGAEAVQQAISGTTAGKVSPFVNFNSFYEEYNIPDYRQIDPENIVVSETSGLGFIGLEQKHIVAQADSSANVSTPDNVSLGNLLITRDDIIWDSNVTVPNAINPDDQWDVVLAPEEASILTSIGDGGTYRYNRLKLLSLGNNNDYFHNRMFDILSANSNGNVTISVPLREFDIYRTADASLASLTRYGATNGYYLNIAGISQTSPAEVTTNVNHNFSQGDRITITGVSGMTEVNDQSYWIAGIAPDGTTFTLYSDPGLTTPVDSTAFTAYSTGGIARIAGIENTYVTISGNTDGVRVGDWVRIFDTDGNVSYNPLHDTVFNVRAVRSGEFDVLLNPSFISGANTVPSFAETIANVDYVNHGSDVNNAANAFQAYSIDHGLTTEISNVTIVTGDLGGMFVNTNTYNIGQLPSEITSTTFFIQGYTGSLPASVDLDVGGIEFRPTLENSYTDISATPVLSIDLRDANTLLEATATVNKSLVTTKIGSSPEDIFPVMDYVDQEDSNLNRVFITQDPAFTSIDVGGLPFTLYEDYENATLSVLNISPGLYTRENNTVRAKLEQWLDSAVSNRDLNLFTSVMLFGNSYTSPSNVTNLDTYNLQLDDTFDDVIFCGRDEARNFNKIVNKIYSQSPFDRAEDDKYGTRGLVNLKNNLEITTLEQQGLGSKITTYPTMESAIILRGASPDTEVFRISLSVYDSYILEYSVAETGGTAVDKYSRVGTLHITARTDFTDPNNAVSVIDTFSSSTERNSVSIDPVVEPRFDGRIEDGSIVIYLITQFRDPLNPIGGDEVGHTLDCDLKIRYLERRWSSTE